MGIPEPLARTWLQAALEEARTGWEAGGIPVGSVIGDPRTGEIIARGHNQRVQKGDPTAHGEMDAIRKAGRRRDWHELVLVTTLSPCPMCAGTAVLLGFKQVLIGEHETFQGAEHWLEAAGIETTVVGCQDCIDLMTKMQRERADLWAEDIAEP
ncbi:MAG: nucleoside deaminase [Phycisphaerales bacterium]|nr:nucleoside deaminase [Phycisphaerales bacterium]